MSKHFGKTWWSAQWLNSLTNIDYSNRLPRGSAYARNGSVTSITVEENLIKAKVKGSRPKPYDITIVIPPFSEPEIKKLIDAIAKQPVIIAKLLNLELDPELLVIAEKTGLKVFPKEWSDFGMTCSCPDWAVPCKHLAAVIYKVSTEIDNDPFLVFSLHKVNLSAELKAKNIHIAGQVEKRIPELFALFYKENPESIKKERGGLKDIGFSEQAYQNLNCSTLSPIHESLFSLLPDAPVFYPGNGNFLVKYTALINKTVRNAQQIVTGKKLPERFFPLPQQSDGSPLIGHHTIVSIRIGDQNIVDLHLGNDKSIPLIQAVTLLWNLPKVHIPNYQPSVAAIRTSLLLAINLLANGALVPQIIRLENKQYAIRWLPAMINKEVKVLVDQLAQMLPNHCLFYESNSPVTKDIALNMVSAWLSAVIRSLSEVGPGDLFTGLFFDGFKYGFNSPGELALPAGIQQWLQGYNRTQCNYKPSIVVDELEDERFQIGIHIEDQTKSPQKQVPLVDVLTLKKFESIRFEVLKSLAQLSSFIPGLDQYINSKGVDLMVMDVDTFTPFLMRAIPVIRLMGMNILLPKSLAQILKPKASVRIKHKSNENMGFVRLEYLLDFDWQVAIGDTVIGEDEFKKMLKKSEGLIKFKTDYIYVSAGDLEKLQKHFTTTKTLSSFEILRAALSDEYYGARVSLTDEVKMLIKQLTGQEQVLLPDGLNATLRPYQERGFSWICRNAQIGFGSLIADDMGLGKTLQVIAALLKFKQAGVLDNQKALIIAPTGLLYNWESEFEKFAPGIICKLYHGTDRKLDKEQDYDVLLTSYGVARSEPQFKKMKWHVVVIDEAQNIKNHSTAQSKAIKSIPANTFIAMSGTPVENRLSELWSIMDFCNRGFLGTLPEFKETFATPIQNQNDAVAANRLKLITSPFLLRRLKSDKSIISDLPDKIEMNSFSQLTQEQTSLYEKTLHKAMDAIKEIETVDQKSLFKRQGLVLQMILALKQICNHPTQFLKNNVLDPSLSGKMELLFDTLENIIESNEKVLIFTQFTEMGNLLKHFITERFGEAPLFYHGGCSIKRRKEMVDTFQSNHADNIFILSLKAAGTGLNLTAASHVIHFDLWWNPAVEAQATDRAYRIGQKNKVMVHRFITKNTFEERINEMIQSKKTLADLTVGAGENWIGNMSNKELSNMFEVKRR